MPRLPGGGKARCCLFGRAAMVAVAGLMLWPVTAFAATTGPSQPEWWIDRGQLYIGGTLESIGAGVDTFISRNPAPVDNETYLRVRLARVFAEGGESSPRHDFNLSSDLPKTRGRLKLIIQSERDDFESLVEQQADDSTARSSVDDEEDNDIEAALRYVWPGAPQWNPDLEIGIRSRLPLDPFVKMRIRRDFVLSDNWRFRNRHELFYYHQNGLGERSLLEFSRPLGESWFFSNSTGLQWAEREGRLEYDNIVSLIHFHRDNKRYIYRTGFFSQQQPRSQLLGYFVEAVYRRRLYKELLYAELTPGVRWLRENDFKDQTTLTFRLLMYFKN